MCRSSIEDCLGVGHLMVTVLMLSDRDFLQAVRVYTSSENVRSSVASTELRG